MSNDSRTSFDIFISYRRDDAAWVAGRIHDFLKIHFDEGRIFRDTEQIALGQKFPAAIQRALDSCKVMLVIIGQEWLRIAYEDGRRRLDNPEDWVRIEISSALERGMLVIPIVVDGAKLPSKDALPDVLQGLVDLQGITSLTDRYFVYQMLNLLDTLKGIVQLASDSKYPHIDELKELVRENLIEEDDEELLEYMRDRLRDEIIEKHEYDSYNEYQAELDFEESRLYKNTRK